MTHVVRKGSTVKTGAKIGKVDSTGITHNISAHRTSEVKKKERFKSEPQVGLRNSRCEEIHL